MCNIIPDKMIPTHVLGWFRMSSAKISVNYNDIG